MTRMTRLDISCMKPYWASYLILIAVTLFQYGLGTPVTALVTTSTMYALMLSTTVFSLQERFNLDLLYGTLALNQRDIVQGRYGMIMLHYLFVLVMGLSPLVLNFLPLPFVSVPSPEPYELLLSIAVSFTLFSLFASFQLPLLFRYGYSKARWLALLPFLVMAIIVMFIMNASGTTSFVSNLDVILNQPAFLLPIAGLICLGSIFLSYRLSLVAYAKAQA